MVDGADLRLSLGVVRMRDPQQILIVDDSRAVAMALSLSLRRAGFETTVAHSAEDGLIIAGERDYDLVLSDQQMQEMSGIDLCRCLRGKSVYRETPFILITANNEALNSIKVRECFGVTAVLGKPFRLPDIVRVVSLTLACACSRARRPEQHC